MEKRRIYILFSMGILTFLLFAALYCPVYTRIVIDRHWDTDISHEYLIAVENGELRNFGQAYGVDIFDNDTINNYLSQINNAKKPLILLLLDKKYSENHFLNYTAHARSGQIVINATKYVDYFRIETKINNRTYIMYVPINKTLLNITGTVNIPENNFNVSVQGYLVFMSVKYSYEAQMITPICNARMDLHAQIIVFDSSGNIVFVAISFDILIAR